MNFIRSMVQSLHSPLFYQRVFRDGKGIGFKYLLQLLTLCWFLVTLVLTYLIFEARQNPDESPLLLPTQILRKISPQFPIVVIEKGKARAEGAQPQTLYDPDTGKPLMLIDTTGKINNLDKSEAHILLNCSSLKMRYDGEDILYEIPEQLNVTIDTRKLEEWADFFERMMPYAPFIMLPFNVIGNLLGLAVRWLLMGGIAFVALKPKLEHAKFNDALRLAAYSLTASIILKMIMIGTGLQPFGSPELVILGVGLLYLFFAVSAVLRQRPSRLLLPPR